MASMQPSQPGAAGGQYEEPPVVNVADLLPATPLSGQGYTVLPQAPTNGAMGQYTIVADPSVFHDDAGTYYVESLDMLKIRLSEIPAIAQLDNMSNSSVFAKALVTSAVRPVSAAANMVMHPMDTVTGLPSGVGDLFGRVSMGATEIASSASNSFGSGKAAGQAGNATLTALGYDQVRRQLAHELHVDPYSSDPILTKKLNHVAWVMFSARMTVSAAMMAVPGSMIITAVTVTNDLVYQTPRADLIILVQKKLKSFGLSQEEIVAFTTNTAIPLSLQVDAVKDLEALGNIPGSSRSGGRHRQHDDRVPGALPGHFAAHARSMGSADQSYHQDLCSRSAGRARSESQYDPARAGRLSVMDTAHSRICD